MMKADALNERFSGKGSNKCKWHFFLEIYGRERVYLALFYRGKVVGTFVPGTWQWWVWCGNNCHGPFAMVVR